LFATYLLCLLCSNILNNIFELSLFQFTIWSLKVSITAMIHQYRLVQKIGQELPRDLMLQLEQLLQPVRMLVPLIVVLDLLLRLQEDFQVLLVLHHLLLLTYCLLLDPLQQHQEAQIDHLIQEQVLVQEPDLLMLRLIKL